MTVKEFYKVVSERCRVDIDLFEDDVFVSTTEETWNAELLFVRSWNVFLKDVPIGDTDYMRREYILHFDLEVKR